MGKPVDADLFAENLADALAAHGVALDELQWSELVSEIIDEMEPYVFGPDLPEHYPDDDPRAPLDDGTSFADPGGQSALRAATRDNPRNLPCPTCRAPNRLTPADKARGYQCNHCADRAESGFDS